MTPSGQAAGGARSARRGRFAHPFADVTSGEDGRVTLLHSGLGGAEADLKQAAASNRILASLGEPRILQATDVERGDRKRLLLRTPAIEGLTSLGESVGRPVRLSWAVHVLMEVCRALDAAHGLGVFHGALTPGSVLVGTEADRPTVKVTDFGLAHLFDTDSWGGGPPQWQPLAPERMMGEQAGPTTDVYLVGALAYALLAGRPVFEGDDVETLLRCHAIEEPPKLHRLKLPQAVPRALSRILLRCLVKEAEDRFDGPADLADALRAHMAKSWREGAPSEGSGPMKPSSRSKPKKLTSLADLRTNLKAQEPASSVPPAPATGPKSTKVKVAKNRGLPPTPSAKLKAGTGPQRIVKPSTEELAAETIEAELLEDGPDDVAELSAANLKLSDGPKAKAGAAGGKAGADAAKAGGKDVKAGAAAKAGGGAAVAGDKDGKAAVPGGNAGAAAKARDIVATPGATGAKAGVAAVKAGDKDGVAGAKADGKDGKAAGAAGTADAAAKADGKVGKAAGGAGRAGAGGKAGAAKAGVAAKAGDKDVKAAVGGGKAGEASAKAGASADAGDGEDQAESSDDERSAAMVAKDRDATGEDAAVVAPAARAEERNPMGWALPAGLGLVAVVVLGVLVLPGDDPKPADAKAASAKSVDAKTGKPPIAAASKRGGSATAAGVPPGASASGASPDAAADAGLGGPADSSAQPDSGPDSSAQPDPTAQPDGAADPTAQPDPAADPSAQPDPTADPSAQPDPAADSSAQPDPAADPSAQPDPVAPSPEDAKRAQARAAFKQANAARGRGESGKAISLYKRAIELRPGYAAAYANLGFIYFNKGDYSSAARYQKLAVRYAARNKDYRIKLGDTYYKMGRKADAKTHWQKAAKLGSKTAQKRLAKL